MMIKPVSRLLLALMMVACIAVPTVHAHKISRQNPYRTFNLSGRNYGSLRWEQQNRKQIRVQTPTHRTWTPKNRVWRWRR